jgi:hypothetical protein
MDIRLCTVISFSFPKLTLTHHTIVDFHDVVYIYAFDIILGINQKEAIHIHSFM